jgi:hypothetical protein
MCQLPKDVVFNSEKSYLCPICNEQLLCRVTENPDTNMPCEVFQCPEHGLMKYGLVSSPQNRRDV